MPPWSVALSEPLHDFLSLSCVPRRLQGEETPPCFDQAVDQALIVFDQVVERCALSPFTRSCNSPQRFHLVPGFGRGGVCVQRDHTGSHAVASTKGLGEKTLGRLGLAGSAQPERQRIAWSVHGAVKLHPHALELPIRLMHAPRVGRGVEMRSAALLQLRCRPLDPARDGGVSDRKTSLQQHFHQITLAERIADRPTHASQHDVGLQVTACERTLIAQEGMPLLS
jgi:hypothetical protein